MRYILLLILIATALYAEFWAVQLSDSTFTTLYSIDDFTLDVLEHIDNGDFVYIWTDRDVSEGDTPTLDEFRQSRKREWKRREELYIKEQCPNYTEIVEYYNRAVVEGETQFVSWIANNVFSPLDSLRAYTYAKVDTLDETNDVLSVNYNPTNDIGDMLLPSIQTIRNVWLTR